MKTILALTDFSESSSYSLLAALKLAEKHQQRLMIYHNNPSLTESLNYNSEIDKHKVIDLFSSYKKVIAALRDTTSNVVYKADNRDITSSLSELVKNEATTLIVMGTQGQGKNRKIWGSTTQRVLDTQKTPVLLIRNDDFKVDIDKLIFASGFKTKDRDIFNSLLNSIFVSPQTELHLVSIDTTSFFSQPTIVMLEAMKSFEIIAKNYVSHTHFYQDYSIESGIVHIADTINPDLIVMAEEHHNNLIKTILGNNETLNIAKRTNQPLLIMN